MTDYFCRSVFLGSIKLEIVISESCYKATILQRNDRKMTMAWSISYNSFVKLQDKKIGSHKMSLLHPNPCYNEVCYCYVGTALYMKVCANLTLKINRL